MEKLPMNSHYDKISDHLQSVWQVEQYNMVGTHLKEFEYFPQQDKKLVSVSSVCTFVEIQRF